MDSESTIASDKLFTTLSISDDLKLDSILVPDVPSNVTFPDDLNNFLRDQIQYLTHENGMLQKNLNEVEMQFKQSVAKVEQLTVQMEELCGAAGSKNSYISSNGLFSGVNLASSKIVEISKKLRERNSEVESLKTKCSKLEAQIFELVKEKKTPNSDKVISEPQENKSEIHELREELKNLKERLNTINNKLCDARNSNMQLKNDLKLANKILIQEIGENFESVQNIIGTTNVTWRGRAQIICDLQQKNNELKEKIKMYQETDKSGSNSGILGASDIRSIQIMKLEKQVSQLSKENLEAKTHLQDNKKKLEASKARIRVLESETAGLKIKMDKCNYENIEKQDVIDSLRIKVAHGQDVQNETIQQKHTVIIQLEKEHKQLQLNLAKKQCKLDNFQTKINDLQNEIETYKQRLNNKQLSVNSEQDECSIKVLNQYKAERLRLLELMKVTSERLEAERNKHAETENRYRIERHRVAKLEAQIARLKLEQQSDRSSNYSTKVFKEPDYTLEYKLQLSEEKMKSLETKLQTERHEHQMDIEEFKKILSEHQFER